MALKDMDSGYKYRAIGAGLILLSVLFIYLGSNADDIAAAKYFLLVLTTVTFGVCLVNYGFTRITIEDKEYERVLRQNSRLELILFPTMIMSFLLSVLFSILGKTVITIIFVTITLTTYGVSKYVGRSTYKSAVKYLRR